MLVVANHTSPLVSVSPLWDFWFTRVLARVAVPFFLMVSGYFLAKDQWRRTGTFLKKTCLLYGAAVLLFVAGTMVRGVVADRMMNRDVARQSISRARVKAKVAEPEPKAACNLLTARALAGAWRVKNRKPTASRQWPTCT